MLMALSVFLAKKLKCTRKPEYKQLMMTLGIPQETCLVF